MGRELKSDRLHKHRWVFRFWRPIEPCTANERRASNGSPDSQAPAGITRSLAMQTSIVPPVLLPSVLSLFGGSQRVIHPAGLEHDGYP